MTGEKKKGFRDFLKSALYNISPEFVLKPNLL
jgi:hypothetical protein